MSEKNRWTVIAAAVISLAPTQLWATPVPDGFRQQTGATAQQQSNQSSDVEITRNIRRALIKDKSLSMRAHNVTIITRQGKVTLKGDVKSDAEKQAVEATAAGVAGAGNVSDELTTATGK